MSGEPCKMPCHRCIEEYDIRSLGMEIFRLDATQMILCESCGNKRCPHASDHRLLCTQSNDPGQKGSVYE